MGSNIVLSLIYHVNIVLALVICSVSLMAFTILAWQDIYCLNADGSLFDAALLSAVAALAHCTVWF